MPLILRRLLKNKSLRLINIVGLTLVFACIFLSYSYLKKEYSYDRFYTNADRIVRMSLAFDGDRPDGRIYGDALNALVKSEPEIQQSLKFAKIETSIVTTEGKKDVVTNVLLSENNFFQFFDLPFVEGDAQTAFDAPDKVAISQTMAHRLYGNQSAIGKTIELRSRRFGIDKAVVSAVFHDMPLNAHFHTDMIVFIENVNVTDMYAYNYLLLKTGTDNKQLEKRLTEGAKQLFGSDGPQNEIINLTPLTDIHLHSNVQKEFEQNGNILYVYLIIGANVLLFIVVLFNLWLNSNVSFSYNKRYYQLLRLNGASPRTVLYDELSIALVVSVFALLGGKIISIIIAHYFDIQLLEAPLLETLGICVILLLISVLVSLLPVLVNMGRTAFSNESGDFKRTHISFAKVKFMLGIQYAIVIFIILLAVAINQQIDFIKSTQVGGNDKAILAMREQPSEVIDNYLTLRSELLKHSEVESVTAGMQLPGAVIRDMLTVKMEGSDQQLTLPIMVVGDDFLPFFQIQLLAGILPPPSPLSKDDEQKLLNAQLLEKPIETAVRDKYVINKAALQLLGCATPQDAIGKQLTLDHEVLAYIPGGQICGVTDNFMYTNVFEETKPMLIITRQMFMNCFMIRFRSSENASHNLAIFNHVWQKVNPDYPPNYAWLDDVYGKLYSNETNAERIVRLFSILCLLVTIIGLLSFTAFMIKIRTREIAVRKVNGASNSQIAMMLYSDLLIWIVPAFVVAVSTSYYVISKWLEYFAYKSTIQWITYGIVGVGVALVSFLAISWQGWRAANANPVESLKSE